MCGGKSHPTAQVTVRKWIIRIFFSRLVTFFTRWLFRFIGLFIDEQDQLEVTQQRVALPNLPAAFAGYRLVQFSDIHMDFEMTEARLARVIAAVNAAQPDLIVITGDFISHHTDARYCEPLQRQLSRLGAPDGVWAILGNHDHVASARRVRACLAAAGVGELRNAAHAVQREEAQLWLAGVDDPYYGHDRLDELLTTLPAASAAVLLAHVPDYIERVSATRRFGLMLAGHSHGGQLGLPFLWPFALPCGCKKYPLGRYEVDGTTLYVNRGVGVVHIPLRFRSRPEVTVFTLEVAP